MYHKFFRVQLLFQFQHNALLRMQKLSINSMIKAFLILLILDKTSSASISVFNEVDANEDDIVYDQRQNGTENFRIRIDGLVVVVPSDIISANSEDSSQFEPISELQHNKPATSFNLFDLGSQQVRYFKIHYFLLY